MQACYATWEDQEILRREISDDSAAAVREMNSQAHRRLMSTVAANSWLLSADVELRCRTMTQVLDTHQETWIDHVDACSLELALVVGDLKAIALKELGKPRFIG